MTKKTTAPQPLTPEAIEFAAELLAEIAATRAHFKIGRASAKSLGRLLLRPAYRAAGLNAKRVAFVGSAGQARAMEGILIALGVTSWLEQTLNKRGGSGGQEAKARTHAVYIAYESNGRTPASE